MSLVRNKKASFNYEIIEKLEAGIELFGHEVKSIKNGGASLLGAYVLVRGGEVFLTGANVSPYQVANIDKSYDPTRARKLLLTKKEIAKFGWPAPRGPKTRKSGPPPNAPKCVLLKSSGQMGGIPATEPGF